MTRTRALAGRTFSSLRVRNYRLYFGGQLVSLTGTWMQSVAQAWLVLKLTGSGVALGLILAAQFLPMLLAGPWGGVIADRFDKRRVLVFTQSSAATLALILGILDVTGQVRLWMVFALAGALGIVNLVDMPTRQSFVIEIVGPKDVANAVSLNSVLVNASRIVGPAMAGLLIAAVGVGVCFLLNAASYVAVIFALLAMRTEELQRRTPLPRAKGQLREGLRYAWSTPEVRVPLLLMAVVGTLGFNFSVLVPLLARFTFGVGASGYGILFALMGAGAVLGGLVIAARGRSNGRLLAWAGLAFGAMLVLIAAAPTYAVAMVVMVPVGAASTAFIATSNSLLQLRARPEMRGRVMALFSMVFIGTTPLGSPLIGWIAQRFGPPAGFVVGGTATLVAAMFAFRSLRRSDARLTARARAATASVEEEIADDRIPASEIIERPAAVSAIERVRVLPATVRPAVGQ